MILDILYHDRAPEQIQRVRMVTFYNTVAEVNGPELVVGPELVIHSQDYQTPQRNISLRIIKQVTYTND